MKNNNIDDTKNPLNLNKKKTKDFTKTMKLLRKGLAILILLAFGVMFIWATFATQPDRAEITTKQYEAIELQLKNKCPGATNYVKKLMEDDGKIDGFDYTHFIRACERDSTDVKNRIKEMK